MAGMITSPTTIGSKGLSDFHTDFTPTSEGIYPTHSIKGDITTVMSDAQFGAGLDANNGFGAKNTQQLTV